MVSRATKRLWKCVAIGLSLSTAQAFSEPAWAQTPGSTPTISAVKDTGTGQAGKTAGDVEAVRKLVQEGRKAFNEGDKTRAEKLARQAQAMRVPMPFWETDTPEKLLIDLGVKTAAAPAAANMPSGDPKALVKQGYEALRIGKLDEAQKCAQSAASNPKAKWGLFDDTPTKLMDDIVKARAARNKDESAKVLASARKLFEQGKYSDARSMAYKASTLHGAYAMWDFGDRPDKLISEIDAAEAKSRKVKVPASPSGKPGDATVAKPGAKPADAGATAKAPAKAPAKPTDASAMAKAGDKSAKPNAMPTQVAQQAKPPAPNWPTEVKTADVAAADPKATTVTTAAGTTMPNAPSGVVQVTADAKAKARQCMAEGKGYWQAGRYVEARAKYLEAAQCQCEWAANEETPDRCLIDLAATVTSQINTALAVVASATTPEQKQAAATQLNSVRAMADGFGLDCAAIDARLSAMQAQATKAVASAQGMIQGQAILEKARLELRRGSCEMARQLATEVFNGQFGMQAEATQVLRSIDVEEHNQRVLSANRNYDAALSAYRTKDFEQSLAIFKQVDANLLPLDKKAQMKEVMVTCQQRTEQVAAAQPLPTAAPGIVAPAVASGQPMTGVKPAGATGITGLGGAKPAMSAPGEGDDLASQVVKLQEVEYQRLRTEGLEIQSKAMSQFERGETDAALESLDSYCSRVRATRLDTGSIVKLCRPIEAKAQSFKLMKAQKDFESNVVNKKTRIVDGMNKEALQEQKRQQQVKDLMKEFNTLYKEGKYKEAEMKAAQAHSLEPDDPATEAAVKLAQIHGAKDSHEGLVKRKEEMFRRGLDDAEEMGPYVNTDKPTALDPILPKIAQDRKNKFGQMGMRTASAKEKEIQEKLNKHVTVTFNSVPLYKAMDDLKSLAGVNIHLDSASLGSESVNPETPVSLKVDDISLKSVLNLLLQQVRLTYVIEDEVLKVTTEKSARGKLTQRVYSVADLVIPVDDYMMPQNANLQSAFDRVIDQQKMNLGTNGSTPFNNQRFGLQNGQNVGTSSPTGASMTTAPGGASMSTQPGNVGSPMAHTASVSPTRQTMQDMLIKLVTNTIAPDSWTSVGGAGTIDYMPIGLALVVNQTPDVQEQVSDLLDALRKLQDLEVSVEVRIITLAETFFERIGLDFALNIKTDHGTRQYEPQLVTNQFKPAGQINDFSPTRFLSGTTPAGNFTSDLDIPIKNSSFQYAIPPFAYPNNPGFNGGIGMGLAFLSDIQVFMFMEAAQGDRRTNVMQAPKLTLFNGQTSTINISDQQFFVTNVNVVGFGGQIVFVPQNNPFPLGVQLAIQAVVSADRRFVRLNLTPTLSNIASAIVPLFPVTTFITPVFEGGAQGQPIPFTQFIQQPQISTVTIQTTVSIPDGGTVILGGLKTLSEGRNEFGPPVLSKLPYINRLFKNVGYGREAQSLLLMVTPRIIINQEEEERQTGVISEAQQPR